MTVVHSDMYVEGSGIWIYFAVGHVEVGTPSLPLSVKLSVLPMCNAPKVTVCDIRKCSAKLQCW